MKPLSLFLNHVVHADCTKLLPLFPSESIDFVCTDPPYLVNYLPRDGRRCPGDDSDEWLEPAFTELYRVLKPDSFCATFYGWPGIDRFMKVWKQSGFRPVSHLTWTKTHCSREGYTQSFHEVGFLLANPLAFFRTLASRFCKPILQSQSREHELRNLFQYIPEKDMVK